jgi:predicted O-linked N-acetylglucosamine transferase (SPINDLY family)
MKKLSGFFCGLYERLTARLGRGVQSGVPKFLHPVIVDEAADAEKAEFERALALHQTGKLEEAESIYREILRRHPDHSDALHYLGMVRAQSRHLDEAAGLMRRALEINPKNEAAHSNRGNVLKALGRPEEALSSYEKAITLNPRSAEALNNRGAVLGDLGRHEEALVSYDLALSINPAYESALFNRGISLAALKRHQEALLSFDNVLATKPDHPEAQLKRSSTLLALRRFEDALAGFDQVSVAKPNDLELLFNRGVVLVEFKRYEEAIASYDRALAIKPDFVEVLNNRGIALYRNRQYEEAVASYDNALAINPDYAEAYNNRGMALSSLERRAEALASYDRAIAINPDFADVFSNRGVVLDLMDQREEALVDFNRALELRPDYPDALHNRGGTLREMGLLEEARQDFSRLFELAPDFEYASGNKLYSHLQVCNWKEIRVALEQCGDAVRDGKRACLPFAFLLMSGSGKDQLTCARTFVAHKFPSAARALCAGVRYQHERIRIAYLSADFHHHATAYLMAELFEKHDRDRFEVSAWSFGQSVEDDMRARLRKAFEHFHEVRGSSDIEVATMLRAREIDIAIDLKGFTQHCRPTIFAHRAAPIQINYLGYPGTMGAAYIDYIIGDAVVTPLEHEEFYEEKVVRLPDTYQVNDSKRLISEHTPGRAEVSLPESGFVFCCFNNNFKIAPEIFDVWMRLMGRVEGSVLWLFADNAIAARNLKIEAEARGVNPERLVFASRMPLPEHLARHRLADLFLDTLPYNAHTTTSDALWAGLPVLTCIGGTFAGRVSASLLRATGLPELVTENLADYESLALRLATTPGMLSELKAKLAKNRGTHPLFDTDRFRRHMESAYITMYDRYQRGDPPQGFSVQAIQDNAG